MTSAEAFKKTFDYIQINENFLSCELFQYILLINN